MISAGQKRPARGGRRGQDRRGFPPPSEAALMTVATPRPAPAGANQPTEHVNRMADKATKNPPATTPVATPEAGSNGAAVGAVNGDYGADQIQVLEGLEAVRKRPGMY